MALNFQFPMQVLIPAAGAATAVVVAGAYIWHAHPPSAPAAQMPVAAIQSPALANPVDPANTSVAIKPGAAAPSFDVVRVEPSGSTVVAGRGAPGAAVTLVDGDKTLAKGKVDPNGQFVLLPDALAKGTHSLALGTLDESGNKQNSQQNVVVSVADPAKGGVVVALAEPGQPTRVLSAPPAPEAVTPQPLMLAPQLAIRTVDVDKNGALFVTGQAPADSNVRVYLNDALVAAAKTGGDGHWTLKITGGVPKGAFKVRVDQVEAASGKVIARAQVPFDVPAVTAPMNVNVAKVDVAKTDVAKSDGAKSDAAKADVVVDGIQTATVSRGDSLWRISRKMLGQGIRYTVIYEANTKQIRNPRLIFPGQVFVVPKAPG